MSIQLDDALVANGTDARITALEAFDASLSAEYGSTFVGAATYAQLRAYDGAATRIQVGGRSNYFDNSGGVFARTGTAVDNDGTVLRDALNRSWVRQFEGGVDVRWFGADPSGANDSYAAFANALLYHDRVVVPPGEFRVDSMIAMGNGKTIYMESGSTVIRKAAAASTAPVFWFDGSFSTIIGEGNDTFIRSDKNSPNGVVRFGAQDMSTAQTTNCNYNKLLNLYVSGATAQGSAANTDRVIAMYGPQISGYTCYFHTIDNCTVANGAVGIDMVGWANACHITNIHFYRAGFDLSAAAFMLRGSLETMSFGCFHHSSPNSASLIVDSYDNTGTPGGSLHTAQFNRVLAFNCEQGGASAKSLRHIAGNYGTYDIGSDVAGGVEFVSYGSFNSFIVNGAVTSYQVEARDKFFGSQFVFPSVQVPSANANTLDDYAEGSSAWATTFSSLVNCSSIAVIRKEFTKIGRQVTVHLKGTLTITSANTLTSFILNLPFAQGDLNNPAAGSMVLAANGVGAVLDNSGATSDIYVFVPANQVLAAGASQSFALSYTYNAAT